MIKNLILAFSCVLSFSAYGQKVTEYRQTSKYLTYVKGDSFEGSSISKDFVLPFMSDIPKEFRFTPTAQDIETAELLLSSQLRAVNAKLEHQGKNIGPVIHDNLPKYARQYYGYITATGERIVLVSNLWGANYKTEQEKSWKRGAVVVMDGGSNYWQIKANLTTHKLFDLFVNGSA
ncbi:MAG: hypothetical protein K0S09_493 [Sphingobacteriaceae bacterium]|jgi:hypothetical protein|nr:hypothetical protein [Sphingobacteriaceae bacterium]